MSCADSGNDDAEAQAALAELCKIYWRPVFAFICRQGFRSLLLKALQRFLQDEADKRSSRKRGGDLHFVSWDDWMAEAPSHLSIPQRESDNWSPERIFDVRWAATVVERALRQLGDECEKRGRRRIFDVLSGCLAAERQDVSYATFARILGLEETAVKSLVYRLRDRYRRLLREEVAQTVWEAKEIDDELRYLCAALAASE